MAKYVELDKSLVNGEKHCLIMTDKEALSLGLLLGRTTHSVFTQHYQALYDIVHKDWDAFRKRAELLDRIDCRQLEEEFKKWTF